MGIGGAGNQIEADAGFFRRAGAGRQHNGVRTGGDDVAAGDLVVAIHLDLRPKFTEIVNEVEGEAVIVVDQEDHDTKNALSARLLDGGRRGVKRTISVALRTRLD